MAHTFGSLLRHLRRRQGLTQEELAVRLGYSRSMVAALESNRRMPDVNVVADLYVQALELTDRGESVQELVDLAFASRGLGHRAPSRSPLVAFTVQRPREESQGGTHTLRTIPVPPTPLIGRERDVQRICDAMLNGYNRLVTLVGPPGIGKTRLSLEVAFRLQVLTEHGAVFVSLAGVQEPEHLAEAIFDALGVQSVATPSIERLVTYLRRQEVLLVLDNFEHLLDAAPMVARILAECANVRVIVTSRERLRLRAEHLAQVQPLSLKAAADLFRARADAADADLVLGEIDHKTIDDICQRLDCLPLALELCAAQADFYTLAEILERLSSHLLDTLSEGASDLPERHRTLRAAIGASYDVLATDEKSMLRTLSVFVGGCTPQAAIDLWCAGRDSAALQPEKLLRSLAAKSLLQVETTPHADKRLQLLQSVRDFARERLIEEGELDALGARHSEAMLRFVKDAAPRLLEQQGPHWLKRVHREWDNFNAALEWVYEQGAWQAMATLLLALNMPFEGSARQNEYFAWCARLLPHVDTLAPDVQAILKLNFCFGAHTGEMAEQRMEIVQDFHGIIARSQNPLIKASLLTWGADIAVVFPDPLAAKRQAIELARSADRRHEDGLTFGIECAQEVVLNKALYMYGVHLYNIGFMTEAAEHLHEVIQSNTHRSRGKDAFAIGYLGRIAIAEGRLDDATILMEKAVSCAESGFDISGTAVWRSFLGMALIYIGDVEEAKPVLSQAWEESCLAGNPFFAQITSIALAELALANSDLDEAREWIAESNRLSAQSSHELDWRNLHRILLTARVAAREGRDVDAVSLYGLWHAYNDCVVVGPHRPVLDNATAEMDQARQRLGDGEYQRILASGRHLPRQETISSLSSFLTRQA